MKFSVIIPVYNGWEYLREGVDSVLGQTGADFEVLLVDDGSTDGESGALCDTLAREHPDCIRVLHKPNGGAGDARNAALPLAQGDYVLFLDSDDSYTPEAFTVLAAALDECIPASIQAARNAVRPLHHLFALILIALLFLCIPLI